MFNKKPLIIALVLIAVFMVAMVVVSTLEKGADKPPVDLTEEKKPIKNIILIVADDLGNSF